MGNTEESWLNGTDIVEIHYVHLTVFFC